MPRRAGNKYGVAPAGARTVDGIVFDSKAEALRYQELRLLERAGRVVCIERQTEYVLVPAYTRRDGTKCRGTRYLADFRYVDTSTGCTVVEDVKGVATEAYRIKRTMLGWLFPDLDFREIRA